MKIPHQKRDFFIPISLVIAVLLSVVCFLSHSSGTSNILSGGLSIITTPLRSGAKALHSVASSVGGYFSDIDKLREENKQLRHLNKQLAEDNNALKLLENENESLYKFLELKKERTDFKFINSNIISKSNTGYSAFFTIDKGSFHGIEAGMPIISDEGALVGVTYSIEPSSSRCKSILSYDLGVGIYNESTGETGILSGSFETFSDTKCLIPDIPDDTGMKQGDKILTSGLGETYPRNLIIGTVESFIPLNGSHTRGAVITPDPSILSADSIMVITSFERIYE